MPGVETRFYLAVLSQSKAVERAVLRYNIIFIR